jgi:ubiquinone/menaquinone biosynthesis C-methylase UbiE
MAYYQQWQRFPKDVKVWQRGEGFVFHEGRISALKYIVNTSQSVLDVGCGIGLDYQPLSNIKYQGVDITPKFVEQARKNGVPCTEASVFDLPFPNNSFDTVYCRNLLLHLPPEQVFQALDEMARAARKQVVTVEPAWQPNADYRIRELIDTNPDDILMFFSNTYAQAEMEGYALKHGLTLAWWRGYDQNRSDFLHHPVEWQVSVYKK